MCAAFNPWFAARQGIIVRGEDTESDEEEIVFTGKKLLYPIIIFYDFITSLPTAVRVCCVQK